MTEPESSPIPTLHEAERRYLLDALFHARVHTAVSTLRVDLHGRPTGRLDDREIAIATQAAALGLLLAEFDPPEPPSDRTLLYEEAREAVLALRTVLQQMPLNDPANPQATAYAIYARMLDSLEAYVSHHEQAAQHGLVGPT